MQSIGKRLPFVWAAGIEDTFITEPWPATGRTLDEYELTGHYAMWQQDLCLMAQLGVSAARHGIPWHRINPEPGVWDWTWADGPLNRLIDLGVEPIVDLVHYGTPQWLRGGFADPSYPSSVAEFARRTAERFHTKIRCFTPLNEPRITAWYCGRLGWWPPYLHGPRGFLAVMMGVCRGIAQTIRSLREVDPEIVIVHVDATDIYEAATPDLAEASRARQELVFLALDLLLGCVVRDHPMWDWAIRNGADAAELEWFSANPSDIDVCGLNLYPMFTWKLLRRESGRIRVRMPYAGAQIIERLARLYHGRYGLPMMITETASNGPVSRRLAWMQSSIEAVRRCRCDGLPLIGYTWWPMFALVAWAYRQGRRPAGAYLAQMGLWDLRDYAGVLERVETELVAKYRDLVAAGMETVVGDGPVCALTG